MNGWWYLAAGAATGGVVNGIWELLEARRSHDDREGVAADAAMRELEVGGRRHRARDGAFHMRPDDARVALAVAECFRPSVRMAGRGWRCPACAFLAVFPRNCGRCGHPELKEET